MADAVSMYACAAQVACRAKAAAESTLLLPILHNTTTHMYAGDSSNQRHHIGQAHMYAKLF